MPKYNVPISWDFTIEASSPQEAEDIVAKYLDSILPGYGYAFGDTLSGAGMVDRATEVRDE